MGWLAAITLALATLAGLWRIGRCPRLALELVGAILLLALAGYGWQGQPDTPGAPIARH